MSAATWAGIALLGGVGASARALLTHAVNTRAGRRFPYGTLVVNLSGALALGVLAGTGVDGDALRLAGTGLLGAYTTFSTWMFETTHAATRGHRRVAVVNVVASLVLGLLAVWTGRAVGRAF